MRVVICVLCLLWVCVSQAETPSQREAGRRTTPEVWHPRVEPFTPAGTLQTEFGSALSEAGYQKLRIALPWTVPSARTDYYFDAYDGGQFLLRTGGSPLKVRIKLKKQGPQWQVSRFVDKDRVAVGPLGIYVHT